jgi:hypothetical protein
VLAALIVHFTAPLGRADVTFTADTIDNNVAIGYGVAVGDVDGDRKLDLLLADKTEFVWYRNPGQRQQPWQRFVMARGLTAQDNVCIAARDLDGDGRVEVAVGGNWNPGETDDVARSGAVFYLQRPDDPQQLWQAIAWQPYDPTTHRMHWVLWREGQFRLLVLPLHGRGNRNGQGMPVRLMAYDASIARPSEVQTATLHESMHMTHNFDVVPRPGAAAEAVLMAGREGVAELSADSATLLIPAAGQQGAGEVRHARVTASGRSVVTIESMHGTDVVCYTQDDAGNWTRTVLDQSLNQGHALVAGDFLGTGRDQIVAGWRNPNAQNRVGIRLYAADANGQNWQTHTIDDNTMACEDLKAADLDGDSRLDLVAAGRATNNLVVYWNR